MPYGDEHLLLIARDITRVSQLEEMRKDFVANVIMDCTPPTVINGHLEILPIDEDLILSCKSDERNDIANPPYAKLDRRLAGVVAH